MSDNHSLDDIKLERTIANQTNELLRVRQGLHDACSDEELQLLLIFNDSDVVEGIDNLLDRCADILTFGALYKCRKCNTGDMIFTKYGYTCNGMKNEWVKCGHFQEKPLRFKCTIPDEIKHKPFFSTCSLIVEDRVIRSSNTEHNFNQPAASKFNINLNGPSATKINVKVKDGTVVDAKSGL